MVVKRLDISRQVLVASPDLLRRQGKPARLQELGRLDSVAMSAVDGRSSLLLAGPQGQEYTLQHQPRYVADDLLTLKFAVLAGTGMGWLPDYMCHDEIADGRLVHLLPEWSPPPGVFHAVFPSRRGLSPAVRSFLDFLAETMPGSSISSGPGGG